MKERYIESVWHVLKRQVWWHNERRGKRNEKNLELVSFQHLHDWNQQIVPLFGFSQTSSHSVFLYPYSFWRTVASFYIWPDRTSLEIYKKKNEILRNKRRRW